MVDGELYSRIYLVSFMERRSFDGQRAVAPKEPQGNTIVRVADGLSVAIIVLCGLM